MSSEEALQRNKTLSFFPFGGRKEVIKEWKHRHGVFIALGTALDLETAIE